MCGARTRPTPCPCCATTWRRPAALGGGTEERYWLLTHYPILDERGELEYILQRPQDVTAQHRAALLAAEAQKALAEAQERTRFILENLSVLIWTAAADGERDYFNPRWLAFTGRTLAEEAHGQWAKGIHPDDRDRVLATWNRSIATGDPYQAEYRLRRHDGQYRWVLARATARRDADGRVLMWVGGATDIHEQRQMVQELLDANEQQAALSEQAHALYQQAESQRATYHNLFMQAPAAICILRGPEHRYQFVNPGYQQLFPHRQLLGQPLAEALPEIQEQGFVDVLDQVFRTGEPFFGKEVAVQLARDASGERSGAYFNYNYQRFQEEGQAAGLIGFGFEVTDLVEARRVLEQARDAALPDATSPLA